MKIKIFLLGVLALLTCGWSGARAASSTAEVRSLELTGTRRGARLVLDLSRSTSHELFTLDKPRRVVVDLRNAELAKGVRVPQGQGIVREIRTGTQPGRTLRVVLDVEASVEPRARWENGARGGRRLVVELGDAASLARNDATSAQSAASAAAAPRKEPQPIRAVHAPRDTNRDVVIAIDAGHGGKDPGAIGRGGTREKDVALAIARALAERINDAPGMRAVLTRDGDYYISHRERIRRARAANADMFISVHADSIRNRDVSGASVYILSLDGASSEAARWLAERENAADLIGGVSLSDKDDVLASVLLDLSQSAAISASMAAAERVLRALRDVGEVRKPQVQQAGFLVLKSPDIPSLLIETAYISNPGDEKRLRTSAHQRKLAEAIFKGIRGYFEEHPPPGTRFAQARRANLAGVVAGTTTP